ncbi:M23 family metallopeptidase [Arthrobacter ginkgonis]|uniref:M23 family metallopeptidase n=1 Tax=Arthrobacter ginkgonis TaxID=1630594 RepID=UPI0031EE80B2
MPAAPAVIPARPGAAPAAPPAAPAAPNAAAPAVPQRPRGESRRAAQPEVRPAVPTMDPDAAGYVGRRFSTSMRYSVRNPETLPDPALELPQLPEADLPAQSAEAPASPAPGEPGNVIAFPQRFQRDTLGLSHKIAAVAAVSGLALAAAYPALGDAAEDRVAKASAAVADVTVPAADGYAVERTALTSTFSKDQQLTELMSAAGGDVTKVETAGVLAQPLADVRVTSRFGVRPDPWGGSGTVTHIGQDYGVECGTEVKAAAAGTVVQAGWAGHSGNRVVIDHGNGLQTTYNHNTSLKVSVGAKVKRGDVVSLSGTTGNSTGCHLHFEVLINGKAVDPAGWL